MYSQNLVLPLNMTDIIIHFYLKWMCEREDRPYSIKQKRPRRFTSAKTCRRQEDIHRSAGGRRAAVHSACLRGMKEARASAAK